MSTRYDITFHQSNRTPYPGRGFIQPSGRGFTKNQSYLTAEIIIGERTQSYDTATSMSPQKTGKVLKKPTNIKSKVINPQFHKKVYFTPFIQRKKVIVQMMMFMNKFKSFLHLTS